jgi:predicted nucleic acid-binding protein
MRNAWWSRGLSILAAVCLGAALGSAPAIAATKQDVVRALGIATAPADYVVLVDNSGSVSDRGLRPDLRRAFGTLLRAVGPQDHLTLVLFAGEPDIVWDDAVGHNRGAILRTLDAAPRSDTDIGAAIEQSLQTLERSDASPVATVILLTDGKHTPPRGSRYKGTSGSAWASLAARARGLPGRLRRSAYAIALAPETDAGLLRQVFGAATSVVSAPVSQLSSLFVQRVRGQVETAKLESVLARDAGARVRVLWPRRNLLDLDPEREEVTIRLRLRSSARELPLRLSDLRVAATGIDMHVDRSLAAVTLAPGRSTGLVLHLRYRGPEAGGLPLVRKTVQRSGTLRLLATVETPWKDVLQDEFGVRPPRLQLQDSARAVRVRDRSGISWVLLAPMLCALVALALLYASHRRGANPAMVGVLEIVAPDAGRNQVDLTGLGRRVSVGPSETVRLGGAKGEIFGRSETNDGVDVPVIELRLQTENGKQRRKLADGESHVIGEHALTYWAG